MFFADWYVYEFWRFVFVQQEVAQFGQSFIDFPPMQAPASFNLEAVKAQIEKAIQARSGR
jgi:arylsulfatase